MIVIIDISAMKSMIVFFCFCLTKKENDCSMKIGKKKKFDLIVRWIYINQSINFNFFLCELPSNGFISDDDESVYRYSLFIINFWFKIVRVRIFVSTFFEILQFKIIHLVSLPVLKIINYEFLKKKFFFHFQNLVLCFWFGLVTVTHTHTQTAAQNDDDDKTGTNQIISIFFHSLHITCNTHTHTCIVASSLSSSFKLTYY